MQNDSPLKRQLKKFNENHDEQGRFAEGPGGGGGESREAMRARHREEEKAQVAKHDAELKAIESKRQALVEQHRQLNEEEKQLEAKHSGERKELWSRQDTEKDSIGDDEYPHLKPGAGNHVIHPDQEVEFVGDPPKANVNWDEYPDHPLKQEIKAAKKNKARTYGDVEYEKRKGEIDAMPALERAKEKARLGVVWNDEEKKAIEDNR